MGHSGLLVMIYALALLAVFIGLSTTLADTITCQLSPGYAWFPGQYVLLAQGSLSATVSRY
jgi:hypothetical protein